VAVIRPFRALRPQADRAESVASVPYDVVNTEEARALAKQSVSHSRAGGTPEPSGRWVPAFAGTTSGRSQANMFGLSTRLRS